MSFLLDTDICSAYLKNERSLFSRFQQHSGRIHVSRITIAELYAWAYCRHDSQDMSRKIKQFLNELRLMEVDDEVALEFGRLRGLLRSQGIAVGSFDLLIAATALVHNLTVVTHNTRDFAVIPSLSVIDWLAA